MGTNQRSQITMTDAEIAAMLEQTRTMTMATIGPDGMPHLVAMWYGLIDGKVSPLAVELAANVASQRWSSPSDMVDAFELAGVGALFGAAEKAGDLDRVEGRGGFVARHQTRGYGARRRGRQ